MTTHARLQRRLLPVLAALALAGACDEPSPAELDDGAIEARDGAGNGGPVFNTNVLEGTAVPAIDTTGVPLGGVRLVGLEVLMGGVFVEMDVASLSVHRGALRGLAGAGMLKIARSGADFLGSRWTFQVGGQEVIAQLVEVERSVDVGLYDPLNTQSLRVLDPERLVYTFVYEDEVDSDVATCAADPDGGARMVIYGDLIVDEATGVVSQRPRTVYFGCLSGAVGKAALWGYAPDSPSLPSLSLDGFTTAIRSVRADYCGDGGSFTAPGNPVLLRDRWGVNEHLPLPFTTEAVWEEGAGAVCVRRIRETGKTLSEPLVCPDMSVIPLCPDDGALADAWEKDGDGDLWTKIPL